MDFITDDGSDEENCPKVTCGPNQFTCESEGRCIPDHWACDGHKDCKSGEDEKDCANQSIWSTKPTACGPREWTCGNGDCIHINWRCDAAADCSDGSDELNCTRKCRDDQFQCKRDGHCIPKSMRCNGEEECLDGTDEHDCPPAGHKHVLVCDETTFQCKNSTKCIKKSLVCDGKDDCGDFSDEPENCNTNECADINNHHCSQLCVDDPIGFHCACYKGYKLSSDNKTCEDIDECTEVYGSCSGHSCRNTKGHFKCSCNEGYELADHRYCKATGQKALIFANRVDIRRLELTQSGHQHYNSLYGNLRSTVALDYSLHGNYLVWSDVAEEKIYIAALNKSEGKRV